MMNSSHLWFRPNGIMDATETGKGMARMLLETLNVGSPGRAGRALSTD